ncbi:MAG: glycosyltransferase [Flavobacteriaceae bacterium]
MIKNHNKSILILLSTYNGEKYLREQLESLSAQKKVNLHILVRDDGSTDLTLQILQDFSFNFKQITILSEANVGCMLSFKILMNYAYNLMPSFDYYAFCDQDDVWDEDKLLCAVDILENPKLNSLRLYTSSYKVVDEKLNFKYNQIFNYRHTLGEALMTINTMGCTMVFTYELMAETLRVYENKLSLTKSKGMPNHDGWMYLTAISLNSFIHYDEVPHINYRQHSKNVVGAFQASLINRLKRVFENKNTKCNISKILLETYKNADLNNINLLFLNATYQTSLQKKIKLISSKEMLTNSFTVNIAYRILLILNKF